MTIQFYNSLTKQVEEFKPIEKQKVSLYSCGPTVYNYVHIGNLRAFIFSDILSKTLSYFNYDVHNVMNLTDVDDKTIRDSKKEFANLEDPMKRLTSLTEKYTTYFLEDLKELHMELPRTIIKATESIKEMQELIQDLFSKGYAYVAEDGIYFNVVKYPLYGKLVHINKEEQQKNTGNRVIDDEYDKDNAQDFALWKFKKEDDEPSWVISIDKKNYEGRPGWHIECSAMSKKILGKTFDIHTGGVDLKFPHHENEIAQSECANGCAYANYFMHNEFLLVDNKKMSKSLGNFFTLRDLKSKGYNGLALRDVFIRSHYRSPMNFTFDSLNQGKSNVKKINDFYTKLKHMESSDVQDSLVGSFKQYMDQFEAALKDDLNTPEAMAAMYNFMNRVNKETALSQSDIDLALEFIERVDMVFSLLEQEEMIPLEVAQLAEKRKEARENKDWGLADNLRDELKKLGFEVKDDKSTKEGFRLSKL